VTSSFTTQKKIKAIGRGKEERQSARVRNFQLEFNWNFSTFLFAHFSDPLVFLTLWLALQSCDDTSAVKVVRRQGRVGSPSVGPASE
jgi:hypothetical protein